MERAVQQEKGDQTPQPKSAGGGKSFAGVSQAPIQRAAAPNQTGLPDGLKSKMEGTFGTNLDSIRVHKNSSFPAKVGAIATAQGNRIDIAPGHYNPNTSTGQKLIGHEAWHTVQQSQGRVKPTMQMKSGHAINDDRGLEAEADAMGERLAYSTATSRAASLPAHSFSALPTVQRAQAAPIIQRKAGFELQTHLPVNKDGEPLEYHVKTFESNKPGGGNYFVFDSDYPAHADHTVLEIVTAPGNKDEIQHTSSLIDYMQQALQVETNNGQQEADLEAVDTRYQQLLTAAGGVFQPDAAHTRVLLSGITLGENEGDWDAMMRSTPQITFGIRLADLVDFMLKAFETDAFIRPMLHKEEDLRQRFVNQLKAYRDVEESERAAAGLKALIATYLQGMELVGKDTEYPKAATPFMARTDFASMFGSMSRSNKAAFGQWVGRETKNDLGPTWRKRFELEEDNYVTGPEVTDWYKSIVRPRSYQLNEHDTVAARAMVAEKLFNRLFSQFTETQLRQQIGQIGEEVTEQAATSALECLLDFSLFSDEDTLDQDEVGIAAIMDQVNLNANWNLQAEVDRLLDKMRTRDVLSRGVVGQVNPGMGAIKVPQDGDEAGMAILENRALPKYTEDDVRAGETLGGVMRSVHGTLEELLEHAEMDRFKDFRYWRQPIQHVDLPDL